MPYENQVATGESLISLEQSEVFKKFCGEIKVKDNAPIEHLEAKYLASGDNDITNVIAIDGSLVSKTVLNGFPGAEASLIQIALVSIDLKKLNESQSGKITPPSVFNEMDTPYTLQEVLPGRNIVHEDGTAPREFFRRTVYEALLGTCQQGHETLLETYRAIVASRQKTFKCPREGCGNELNPEKGVWSCPCQINEKLYETDPLRFHERFNELGANGEAHGEVMRFLELILFLNVMRYFVADDEAIKILPSIAFVLDGPLAAFGQFAAIVPYVRSELKRINALCEEKTGRGILLFSLTKTGQFCEHFESLDFDRKGGPGERFDNGAILLPDIKYIHRNIVFRPEEGKFWGQDTYFGRVVLYKSKSGQRMVVNTPQVCDVSQDLECTDEKAYARLASVLGVVDRLSTYLFEGGFVPIVRAHSHAAIPLKMGGEIIKSLFEKK